MVQRQLTIPIFFTGDFPEGGATSTRMRLFAKGLKEAGAFPELYILWGSGFNDTGMNMLPRGVWEWIPYLYLSHQTKRPVSAWGKLRQTLFSQWKMCSLLIRKRKQWKYIYCYAPDLHFFWPLYIMAKLLGIKIVSEFPEKKSAQYLDPGTRKSVFYRLSIWSEYIIPKWSDHVMVISSALQILMENRIPASRITVLPVYTDPNRFAHLPVPEDQMFGYLGSFGVKDGVPGLINAFAKLNQQFPQSRLKLMGYCENYERVSKIVHQLNLEGKIILTGPLRFEEVANELGSCSVLLLTRIDSSFAHHGFPTKLAEYLSTGRTVIATQIGDIDKYCEHGKHIYMIPPEQPDALFTQMKMCIENPHPQMGKQGQILAAEKFHYQIGARKLLSLLEQWETH